MNIKEDIFKSFKWSAIDKFLTQGIQFVFGIILARIVSPGDFGVFSLLLLIVAYIQILVDSGFSKAIIQSQEKDTKVLSTVFYFNLGISSLAAILIYFNAGSLSDFITSQDISTYIAATSGILIINAFLVIPNTVLTIALNFKSLAKINLISSVIAGSVAVFFAFKGAGLWALIINIYLKALLSVSSMFFFSRWIPSFYFSKEVIKKLYPFGSNLLASSILNLTVNNLSTIFIGKYIAINQLGYYSRGTQFTDTFFSVFVSILDSALLPNLSKIKDDIYDLSLKIKQITQKVGFVIIPFYTLLIVLADPLVKVLLTNKWSSAIPIIQLFSLSRMISVISTINVNLLYVLGKPNLALRQQYFKVAIRVVILLITFKYGIIYIAIGELVNTIIAFFINSYYPNKIMKLGFIEQTKGLNKIVIAAFGMGAGIYIINEFITIDFLKLIVGGILGGIIYMGSLYLFDKKFVKFLIQLK